MEAHSDEELIMATKDRKYSFWWDADRNLKDTRGVMIPEGYELDKTWPGRPWICPIRSCRVVCKNTWSLGSHFTKLHSSVSLNDNKDELPAAMVKPKDVSVDDEADKDVDLYRQDATSFSYRRSGRLRSQAETTPSEPQKRPFASTDMASSTSQAVSIAREKEASSLRGAKRIRAAQNAPHQDPTPSAIQESLEAEDWEREAKAIPKQNGSSDNLAVSSSYNLSTHQNPSTASAQIWSSPSFSLHVIKIPSGGSHHLRATSDESSSSRRRQQQTRMCTVIAGKLRVKVKVGLEGEEDDTGTEFNIGLHGLFKLENEMECKVENWGYNEAVLQVVGVRGGVSFL
ncbi:hypothetical protein N0V85_006439 [Neurospora sp. IMI 360204]|nr:hypothetical protein N0V85_006439 [Neurospora sp. IMI 360204]